VDDAGVPAGAGVVGLRVLAASAGTPESGQSAARWHQAEELLA